MRGCMTRKCGNHSRSVSSPFLLSLKKSTCCGFLPGLVTVTDFFSTKWSCHFFFVCHSADTQRKKEKERERERERGKKGKPPTIVDLNMAFHAQLPSVLVRSSAVRPSSSWVDIHVSIVCKTRRTLAVADDEDRLTLCAAQEEK